MSYKTVEVNLDNGRVQPAGAETLPARARALLTIIKPADDVFRGETKSRDAGLRRFLSRPPLNLTQAQFKASMETDLWDQ